MSLRGRMLVSLLVGVVLSWIVASIAAQTSTTTVRSGYAAKTQEVDGWISPVWNVDVLTSPAHRRISYWSLQISGQLFAIAPEDFKANEIDLSGEPAHLQPVFDKLDLNSYYGECGWPLPAFAYSVHMGWGANGPSWSGPMTVMLGETAGGEPRFLPLRPLWIGLGVNSLLGAVLVFAGLELVRLAHRAIRVRAGCCRVCGYDLVGVQGPCPECGRIGSGAPADAR